MNKEEYLAILRKNLRNIPAEEVDGIMQFYIEYFEEAGEENEESVIKELGNPEVRASKVSADYVIKDMENHDEPVKTVSQAKKQISNVWVIILAVCAFPIWFPLGIAAASVAFAIMVVILSLLFAFAVTAIAVGCGGVCSIVSGVILMFMHPATGISAIGSGAIMFGLGALFLILIVNLANGTKILFLKIAKKRVKKGATIHE